VIWALRVLYSLLLLLLLLLLLDRIAKRSIRCAILLQMWRGLSVCLWVCHDHQPCRNRSTRVGQHTHYYTWVLIDATWRMRWLGYCDAVYAVVTVEACCYLLLIYRFILRVCDVWLMHVRREPMLARSRVTAVTADTYVHVLCCSIHSASSRRWQTMWTCSFL